MKAIQVNQFGGPEVLQYQEVAELMPGAGEVRVRLFAASVNPVETYIRAGAYASLPTLPYVPGSDGAGIIDEVGEAVTAFAKGDRVFTTSLGKQSSGTYAEMVICDSKSLFKLPSNTSFEQGAALGTAGLTAIQALYQRGQVRPEEIVLIHGATGGVGTFAVQLAKLAGATVIATAGSQAGMELLQQLGADHVLNHRETNYLAAVKSLTKGHGVDLLVEMLAYVNLEHDFEVMAQRGRIVIVGNRGSIEINPRAIMAKDLEIRGVMLSQLSPSEINENLSRLLLALENGVVPVIEKKIPLAEAAKAHREIMQERGSLGKIILTV